MPVITFANSKGGSGKTTSALVLACELAEATDVVLIDADHRRPLISWYKPELAPQRLTVIKSEDHNGIMDQIDEMARKVPFVIIDLEGIASQLGTYAMQQSDLVIIPTQEQVQDTVATVDTLAAVYNAGRGRRMTIPSAILLTRTHAVGRSKTNQNMREQLKAIAGEAGSSLLATPMAERSPFSAIYETNTGLRALGPNDFSKNVYQKAVNNAASFAEEVIELLTSLMGDAPTENEKEAV
jgi:chromosome partitioning protein